jgi:hypothetical protein
MFLSSLPFALVENLTGQSTLERERERKERIPNCGIVCCTQFADFFSDYNLCPWKLGTVFTCFFLPFT